MKGLYLALAIVGAVVPWALLAPHLADHGLAPSPLVSALFDTPVARSFTADLLISGVAFWTFVVHQRRRDRGPNPLPFVAITLVVGLSCALPAYLYARERREGGGGGTARG